MSGYTPLFGSLTTGTLYGRWPDVGLWGVILSLSDRRGIVDVTPQYIAGVTGLPVDEVTACMRRFCEPDPYSRSKSENGARLKLIDEHRDWGWLIVNHAKYSEKVRLMAKDAARTESGRDAERKRIERAREAAKDADPRCPPVSPGFPLSSSCSCSSSSSSSETDTEKDSKSAPAGQGLKTKARHLHEQIIDAYHRQCVNLPPIKTWPKHRIAKLNARIRERCADGKPADTLEWWERFFESVAASDFLSGRTAKPFTATIDWLLGPENFCKVIEGNFANRKPNGVRAHG